MNGRMLFKFIFILCVLLFMVLMGMSNKDVVNFRLDLFGLTKSTQAALMYFIFFGAGVLTGGVLALGTGKGSSSKKKEA